MNLFVLFLAAAQGGAEDPQGFTNSTQKALEQGTRSLQTIQQNVTVLDNTAITPTSKSNNRLLKRLHQVSLVLDGKSSMHELMKKNRNFLNFLNDTITSTSLPGLKRDLSLLKAQLIDEQNLIRANMTMHLSEFYSENIEKKLLTNFTNRVQNDTVTTIRDLSRSLHAIQLFVDAPENSDLLESKIQSETLYNRTVPAREALAVLLSNELEFVNRRIALLRDVAEPARMDEISKTVANQIAGGLYNISATASKEVSAKKSVFKNAVNETAVKLNTDFNQTKNALIAMLSDNLSGSADEQIAAMVHYTALNNNHTKQLASLKESIAGRIQMVRDGKESVLQSIRPFVAGLGDLSTSQTANATNLINEISANLNATENLLRSISNKTGADGVANFTTAVDSMYSSNINLTERAMVDLKAQVAAELERVKETSASRINATKPAADQIAAVRDKSILETIASIETAKGLISKSSDLKKNQIETLFSEYLKNQTDKVIAVQRNAKNSTLEYMSLASKVGTDIQAQFADLMTLWHTSLESLSANELERVTLFRNGLVPFPSVESKYNETLERGEVFLVGMEKNLTEMNQNLIDMKSKQKIKIDQLFQILHSLDDSVSNTFDGNFTLTKSGIESNSTDFVSEMKRNPVFASNEIDQLNNKLRADFAEIKSVVSKATLDITAYSEMKQLVDKLVDEVRAKKLALDSLGSQLSGEYSQNVSIDKGRVDQKIQSEMSQLRTSWSSQVLKNIESNNATNELNTVLSNVTPDLVYSNDNTQFRHSITASETGLASMDTILSGLAETIRNKLSQVRSDSDAALSTIQSELVKLIDMSTTVSSSRVTAFHTGMGASIDAAVEKGKSDIMNKLKTEFSLTENVLNDYLNFLNSTSIGTLLQTESKNVRIASLELGKEKMKSRDFLKNSKLAFSEQKAKNIAIHQQLVHIAEGMLDRVEAENRDANKLGVEAKLNQVEDESDFVKNLTFFGHNEMVPQLTRLMTPISVNKSKELELVNMIKFREQLASIVNDLNQTKLFELLHQVTDVDNSVHSIARNAHMVFQEFLTNQTREDTFAAQIQRDNKVKYTQLINRLASIVDSTGMRIPELVNAENANREMTFRSEADKIEETLEGHIFPSMESRNGVDTDKVKLSIQETRNNIKESVEGIPKPRNFQSEIDDIRKSISRIQQGQEHFVTNEEKLINDWHRKRLRKG